MAEHRLAAPQPKNELKQYANFFYKGGRAPAGSLRRRSFLQATRYILKFIFWRLVRYAKYALVGAAVAAVGTGVLGTVTTGAGWLLFPTSIPAGMVMGTVIGTVKFGWQHFGHAKKRDWHGDARLDERNDASTDDEEDTKLSVWERL